MATTKFSTIIGSSQVVPNYEPWTTVSVVNSITTNATTTAKRRCTFEFAEYDITVAFTGANTQGVMQITLPTSDVIDTSVFIDPVNYNLDPLNSKVTWTKNGGVARGLGGVFANSTSTVRVYDVEALVGAAFVASTPLQVYSNTIDTSVNRPFTFASGDSITIRFQVPLVRLAGGQVAQGAGLATSLKPGIVYRSPQTALTVAGTGWTTTRAVGIAYMDNNGVWRMTFNIFGSVTSTARTIFGITVTGIVAKNVATLLQGIGTVANTVGTVPPSTGYIGANSNAMTCEHGSATTVSYSFSGDIELESKPSWA